MVSSRIKLSLFLSAILSGTDAKHLEPYASIVKGYNKEHDLMFQRCLYHFGFFDKDVLNSKREHICYHAMVQLHKLQEYDAQHFVSKAFVDTSPPLPLAQQKYANLACSYGVGIPEDREALPFSNFVLSQLHAVNYEKGKVPTKMFNEIPGENFAGEIKDCIKHLEATLQANAESTFFRLRDLFGVRLGKLVQYRFPRALNDFATFEEMLYQSSTKEDFVDLMNPSLKPVAQKIIVGRVSHFIFLNFMEMTMYWTVLYTGYAFRNALFVNNQKAFVPQSSLKNPLRYAFDTTMRYFDRLEGLLNRLEEYMINGWVMYQPEKKFIGLLVGGLREVLAEFKEANRILREFDTEMFGCPRGGDVNDETVQLTFEQQASVFVTLVETTMKDNAKYGVLPQLSGVVLFFVSHFNNIRTTQTLKQFSRDVYKVMERARINRKKVDLKRINFDLLLTESHFTDGYTPPEKELLEGHKAFERELLEKRKKEKKTNKRGIEEVPESQEASMREAIEFSDEQRLKFMKELQKQSFESAQREKDFVHPSEAVSLINRLNENPLRLKTQESLEVSSVKQDTFRSQPTQFNHFIASHTRTGNSPVKSIKDEVGVNAESQFYRSLVTSESEKPFTQSRIVAGQRLWDEGVNQPFEIKIEDNQFDIRMDRLNSKSSGRDRKSYNSQYNSKPLTISQENRNALDEYLRKKSLQSRSGTSSKPSSSKSSQKKSRGSQKEIIEGNSKEERRTEPQCNEKLSLRESLLLNMDSLSLGPNKLSMEEAFQKANKGVTNTCITSEKVRTDVARTVNTAIAEARAEEKQNELERKRKIAEGMEQAQNVVIDAQAFVKNGGSNELARKVLQRVFTQDSPNSLYPHPQERNTPTSNSDTVKFTTSVDAQPFFQVAERSEPQRRIQQEYFPREISSRALESVSHLEGTEREISDVTAFQSHHDNSGFIHSGESSDLRKLVDPQKTRQQSGNLEDLLNIARSQEKKIVQLNGSVHSNPYASSKNSQTKQIADIDLLNYSATSKKNEIFSRAKSRNVSNLQSKETSNRQSNQLSPHSSVHSQSSKGLKQSPFPLPSVDDFYLEIAKVGDNNDKNPAEENIYHKEKFHNGDELDVIKDDTEIESTVQVNKPRTKAILHFEFPTDNRESIQYPQDTSLPPSESEFYSYQDLREREENQHYGEYPKRVSQEFKREKKTGKILKESNDTIEFEHPQFNLENSHLYKESNNFTNQKPSNKQSRHSQETGDFNLQIEAIRGHTAQSQKSREYEVNNSSQNRPSPSKRNNADGLFYQFE